MNGVGIAANNSEQRHTGQARRRALALFSMMLRSHARGLGCGLPDHAVDVLVVGVRDGLRQHHMSVYEATQVEGDENDHKDAAAMLLQDGHQQSLDFLFILEAIVTCFDVYADTSTGMLIQDINEDEDEDGEMKKKHRVDQKRETSDGDGDDDGVVAVGLTVAIDNPDDNDSEAAAVVVRRPRTTGTIRLEDVATIAAACGTILSLPLLASLTSDAFAGHRITVMRTLTSLLCNAGLTFLDPMKSVTTTTTAAAAVATTTTSVVASQQASIQREDMFVTATNSVSMKTLPLPASLETETENGSHPRHHHHHEEEEGHQLNGNGGSVSSVSKSREKTMPPRQRTLTDDSCEFGLFDTRAIAGSPLAELEHALESRGSPAVGLALSHLGDLVPLANSLVRSSLVRSQTCASGAWLLWVLDRLSDTHSGRRPRGKVITVVSVFHNCVTHNTALFSI
jgi:hypothetical protein